MTQITLLDGSIGQELVKRAGDRPTPLWSTSVMLEYPHLVREVHGEYFDVGATIATTNTYAVHRDRLPMGGIEDKFDELVEMALQEAEAAVAKHGSGRIAASLGPLGASYRPDICPPPDEAEVPYAELVGMMDARVDLFLIETASSVAQAEGALRGCRAASKPVWLSVTVNDDDGSLLRSGEGVGDLAGIVETYAPDAVLVNCSRPEAIAAALDIIKGLGNLSGPMPTGSPAFPTAFFRTARRWMPFRRGSI